mmetsp:Transcript_3173/g.14728  ORF Transcript_3173/g.14728 Transcript_3173/m.14728 type:complete len:436 (-) Transcript_3173:3381-4688(-)
MMVRHLWLHVADSSLGLSRRIQRGSAASAAVTLVQDAQKSNGAEKSVLATIAQLFSLCGTITPMRDRLKCLINLCQLLFKLDCVDDVSLTAASTTWTLESGYVKALVDAAPANPAYAAEVVTALCSSCLRMIRYVTQKRPNRMKVLEAWFSAVCVVLKVFFRALSWSRETIEVLTAKEYLLRLFELGMDVDKFFEKYTNVRRQELEGVQQELILLLSHQRNPRIKALAILTATYQTRQEVIDVSDNGKQILKALWNFFKGGFEDTKVAESNMKSGLLWKPMKTETTLLSDNAYLADLSTRTLVQRVPAAASRTVAMLKRYLEVLAESKESDVLATDLVETSLVVLSAYDQPNFPKKVEPRTLTSFANAPQPDPLLMLLPPLSDALLTSTVRLAPFQELTAESLFEALVLQDDGSSTADPKASSRGTFRSGSKTVC